mmetsp:Transcript_6830/g.17188  ORF Transcript_6830/g.17188 Transcript_6830/m.17188 type:complete len:263 (-) Transcript_6830:809-1597(-)
MVVFRILLLLLVRLRKASCRLCVPPRSMRSSSGMGFSESCRHRISVSFLMRNRPYRQSVFSLFIFCACSTISPAVVVWSTVMVMNKWSSYHMRTTTRPLSSLLTMGDIDALFTAVCRLASDRDFFFPPAATASPPHAFNASRIFASLSPPPLTPSTTPDFFLFSLPLLPTSLPAASSESSYPPHARRAAHVAACLASRAFRSSLSLGRIMMCLDTQRASISACRFSASSAPRMAGGFPSMLSRVFRIFCFLSAFSLGFCSVR